MNPRFVGMCGGEGATFYRVVAQKEEETNHYSVLSHSPRDAFSQNENSAMSVFGFIDKTSQQSEIGKKLDMLARICLYNQCNEVKKKKVIVLSIEGNALACSKDLKYMFKCDIIDVQASKVIIAAHGPSAHYLGKAK